MTQFVSDQIAAWGASGQEKEKDYESPSSPVCISSQITAEDFPFVLDFEPEPLTGLTAEPCALPNVSADPLQIPIQESMVPAIRSLPVEKRRRSSSRSSGPIRLSRRTRKGCDFDTDLDFGHFLFFEEPDGDLGTRHSTRE